MAREGVVMALAASVWASGTIGVDVYGATGANCVESFSRGSAGYSLVSEPWLPVLTTSGMRSCGLSGVFDPDVIAIATGDDLEDAALTRLLLAIHIAATECGLVPQEWVDVHRSGFDLFDVHRPFWQNPGMAQFAKFPGAVRPLVSASYRHAGRGSTAVNVWHNASELVFDSGAAARLLVVRQQFSVGGKQPFTTAAYGSSPMSAKTSVATIRPFLWLDDGRLASSLAATAALSGTHPVGQFWFTWPRHARPADTGCPSGVLDGLTWQSRSMLLFRGGGDIGPGIMVCDGLRWPEFGDVDAPLEPVLVPHTIYCRPDGSDRYVPQRVHPERPAWHQLAVMCADPHYPGGQSVSRPTSPSGYPRWRLGGLGAYQAAISGPITASFPVPADPSGLRDVLTEMSLAYRRIGSVTAALAKAVSGFAGYRAAIPSHTGCQAELEVIAADVATGRLSPSHAVTLIEAIADSTISQAYQSVAQVRPVAAARVAVQKPRHHASKKHTT